MKEPTSTKAADLVTATLLGMNQEEFLQYISYEHLLFSYHNTFYNAFE